MHGPAHARVRQRHAGILSFDCHTLIRMQADQEAGLEQEASAEYAVGWFGRYAVT